MKPTYPHSLCVAMIIQAYYPRIGGAESQLGAVSPELQKQNVAVSVLTRRYKGLAKFEMVNGVAVYRLPIPGPKPTASLGFTVAALPLLRSLRPTVIHAHEMFSPTTTAITAKRFSGTPVVVTVHSCGKNGEVERLKRKTMGARRIAEFRDHVNAFVVINRDIDAELAAIGVPSERRVFIPNGVDTTHFAPPPDKHAMRALLNLPDAPTAIYTGRLAPEKQLDILVALWGQVREKISGARLLLVGQGKEEAALKKIAGAGVQFIGATHDVAPYLQAADLFVLPSSYEGLSVSLLEAMSSGLPAVATCVGGNPEVIAQNENGWLVPPGDAKALRFAIITLFQDTPRREAMGRNAREHIVRNYELAVTARKLRELYERVRR